MPELCPFQTVPFGMCSLPPPYMETELAVDKEITILSHIAQGEHVRQRDLSHVIGMSLGMTNAILKRLVHKGYLTVRKVNNRNIAYAVTPAGVEAIAKRSYRYFRRTIRNIVYYREAIEAFVHDLKSRGYQGIAFAGVSDLDFIVEHACGICGMSYLRDDASIDAARAGSDELYLLYSESCSPGEEENHRRPAAAFLQEVVSQAAEEAVAGAQ
jgi:DNA-binding MarR family transcriptional regulator